MPGVNEDRAPAPLYFYAAARGGTTLDEGEGGGNPFASAFVELLDTNELTLGALGTRLAALTEHKSGGWQRPDLPALAELASWRIIPKRVAEVRQALVIVFSDYSASGGMQSLPGAQRDAHRVAVALQRAAFDTRTIVDPTREALREILTDFATQSAVSEVALLYTTGHGVDVGGTVYLLPGDYPIAEGARPLPTLAVRLADIAAALRAKRANLVFYAGCRDDPFE